MTRGGALVRDRLRFGMWMASGPGVRVANDMPSMLTRFASALKAERDRKRSLAWFPVAAGVIKGHTPCDCQPQGVV